METKEQMYYDAIEEIAEYMGDSLEKPISVSLLCLRFGINRDQKEKCYHPL